MARNSIAPKAFYSPTLYSGGVYSIVGPQGWSYIGSARCFGRRFREHWWRLVSDSHHCCHLQRAWKKHGEGAFTFTVLQEIDFKDPRELLTAEQSHLDSRMGTLYNSTPTAGSLAGRRHSEAQREAARTRMLQFRHSDETKRLISASKLGRDPWNKGVPMKDAQKVKLSVKATGRKRAEAVKEQLSAAFRKSWAEGKRAKPVVPPLKKKSLAMQSPIMDLAAEGISLTEIGRRLGMRRHTVARIVRLTSTA